MILEKFYNYFVDEMTFEIQGKVNNLEQILRFEITNSYEILSKTPSSKYFVQNKNLYLDIKQQQFGFLNFYKSGLIHYCSYKAISEDEISINSILKISSNIIVLTMIAIIIGVIIGGANKSFLIGLISFIFTFIISNTYTIVSFYMNKNICRELTISKINKIRHQIKILN